LTGTISDKRLSQIGKDRALLLTTGFHHGENAVVSKNPCNPKLKEETA
jgi:hypothetical protein